MKKNKWIAIVVLAVLAVGVVCAVSADMEQDYDDKCSGCHGTDGLGDYAIDGSVCSLESIEEIVDCYDGIGAHGSVSDCDETCEEETNTYVYEVLLLAIAEDEYVDLCAGCHGDDGLGYYALDASVCDMDSIEAMVDCYPGISSHDSVTNDDTVVWNTNRYIYEVIGVVDAEDKYNGKCAGCHGEDGLGYYEIDGSNCSLESADAIIACYNESDDISAHDSVSGCGESCIEETNTYIYDVLLPEIGEGLYMDLCASCHGDDGMGSAPLDGSVCDLETLDEILECYPGISAHGGVTDCDDTCVLLANRYVFDELLSNAVDDDDTTADDSSDDSEVSQNLDGTSEDNGDWVSCFIETCLSAFRF
jgi:mono/diheme cytochrome c family protein